MFEIASKKQSVNGRGSSVVEALGTSASTARLHLWFSSKSAVEAAVSAVCLLNQLAEYRQALRFPSAAPLRSCRAAACGTTSSWQSRGEAQRESRVRPANGLRSSGR